MVTHIAKSSDKVLEYFTEPFEIRDRIKYKDGSKRKHIFVFPYISQLLDLMIENNSTYLKQALEKIVEHNERTEKILHLLIKQSIEDSNNSGYFCKNQIEFHDNGNIILFHNMLAGTGIITNIAKVKKKSNNHEINQLIKRLNNSYNSIKYINENDFI